MSDPAPIEFWATGADVGSNAAHAYTDGKAICGNPLGPSSQHWEDPGCLACRKCLRVVMARTGEACRGCLGKGRHCVRKYPGRRYKQCGKCKGLGYVPIGTDARDAWIRSAVHWLKNYRPDLHPEATACQAWEESGGDSRESPQIALHRLGYLNPSTPESPILSVPTREAYLTSWAWMEGDLTRIPPPPPAERRKTPTLPFIVGQTVVMRNHVTGHDVRTLTVTAVTPKGITAQPYPGLDHKFRLDGVATWSGNLSISHP